MTVWVIIMTDFNIEAAGKLFSTYYSYTKPYHTYTSLRAISTCVFSCSKLAKFSGTTSLNQLFYIFKQKTIRFNLVLMNTETFVFW